MPRTEEEAFAEAELVTPMSGAGMSGAAALVAQGATLMRVENDAMLAVAIQRPRDQKRIMKAAIDELQTYPDEAKKAYYSIPYREKQPDGKYKLVPIEGPSVKASNALARLWGNCSVTSRSLGEDATGADLAGIFVDFETNFRMERPFRATKIKKMRRGGTYTLNPQQWIAELQAAASKAQRNATINGLPAGLIGSYMKQARILAAGDPEAKADPKKVTSTLRAFERFKVTQDMLEKYVGKPIAEWMGDNLATLIGLGNALADEQLTVAEAFDLTEEEKPAGPATANGVTAESILAGTATGKDGASPGKPAGCSHPDVPPSAVSGLAAGETVTCKACGEALSNPEAKPLSVPPADTKKGAPRQTRLQE